MLEIYIIALYLTIFSEVGVAYFFGLRTKKEIFFVVLASLITHPILHISTWFIFTRQLFEITFPIIIIFEILIAFTEAIILWGGLRRPFKEMITIAFLMNAMSFLLGEILL